jgi:hypothetical protein
MATRKKSNVTIRGGVQNVYVAGETLTVESARQEAVDPAAWFDAEFRLAKEHLRRRRTEEADATLDRLIARADAERRTEWSVRARVERVWRKAEHPTTAEAERLLEVCESLARNAKLPDALLGSMLRARCRLQVMKGEAAANAALSVLSEYSGRAVSGMDGDTAYQVLRAGADLAMLHAGFRRWDEAEAALRRTEDVAVGAPLAGAERARTLRSIEEVRLRIAVEQGNMEAVEAIAKSLTAAQLPDEAEDNATVLQHYANMARHMEHYDCGIACAAAASRAARTAGLDEFVLGADQTHATLLCMAGRVVEGLRLNEAVARRAEASNSLKVLVAAHLLAADHALQQEDGAAARRYAEAALDGARGDEMGELFSLQCLADACHLQGDFHLAHAHVAEALRLGARLGMPPPERARLLHRAVDLVGQEGGWDEAERYLVEWASVATDADDSASEVAMARHRVEGYRQLRTTFESLKEPEAPKGTPPSIHEGLSELVKPVLEWWDDLGRASPDQLDYWGRGNFIRALKHLGRYPRAFTIVLEARTRGDIERSLRLCGLVADVVLVLWKGPCREGRMFTIAPLHHDGSGGAGYILAAGDRLQRDGVRGTWVPAIATGRMLPDDVIDLLAGAGRPWFGSGRLLVVPAWSAGCINPGFGALERLLTDAVRGIPVVRSASQDSLPWQMVPWFPEVPLRDLAEIASDPQFNRPRLRQLFIERSRLCANQPMMSVARELEQEIDAELMEFRDRVKRQRDRHGWTAADEAWTNSRIPSRSPPRDSETESPAPLSPWRPFLRIGELGYEWQIMGLSHAFEPPRRSVKTEGERFQGAGEWLAPEDEGPRMLVAQKP